MKFLKSWAGSIRNKFRAWRRKGRLSEASEQVRSSLPLREFVYLDAVSLHSLLVSQNATIPAEVSQAISRADEAEVSGKVATKVGSDLVGASTQAELGSRFQTSNSNSTQSSRKAVIQTLFKELRELPLDFKLANRPDVVKPFESVSDLTTSKDSRLVEASTSFERGDLIEIEVILAVDPVFSSAQ